MNIGGPQSNFAGKDPADVAAAAAEAAAAVAAAEAAPHPPATILLVEDSDTQALRMQLHLQAEGWRVLRAADGAEARRLLADSPPDLVLLDFYLPDARGDELCRELRAREETRRLPVLMLTTAQEREDELRGLQSGADDYVSKTAPVEVVLERLRGLLRKSQAERTLTELYRQERRVALALQQSLLSAPPPDAFSGVSLRMRYEPAWEEALVGGDFYDIRKLENGCVSLVVGDVAGKGLAAATFTAEAKFALRAILHERPDEPGGALGRLNDLLVEGGERNPWTATALLAATVALYDPTSGEVSVAGAGAELPLLLSADGRSSDPIRQGAFGPMLGIEAGIGYDTVHLTLAPGESLLLFTDGVTEARQRRSDLFGFQRAAEVAETAFRSGGGSLDAVVDGIIDEARRFAGGRLPDDVCLLAIRRGPAA